LVFIELSEAFRILFYSLFVASVDQFSVWAADVFFNKAQGLRLAEVIVTDQELYD